MTLFSKSHEDLMKMFEVEFKGRRLDKETKEFWAQGNIYQDGTVNDLFLAYRRGYAYGTAVAA